MQVLDWVKQEKIVAIVRGDYSLDALKVMGQALHDCGINLLEITMNSAGAVEAIAMLVQEFGDRMCIGAGTVLDVAQVDAVAKVGARFVVAPETYDPVIKMALGLGLEPMPGAFTPSEIMSASRAGARLVKLFPAVAGGPDYVKQVRAPLGHVDLMVTGGVEPDSARAYLDAGAVAVGMGSSLVPKKFDGSPEAAGLLIARGKALVEAVRG